jgi:hypothetical protein
MAANCSAANALQRSTACLLSLGDSVSTRRRIVSTIESRCCSKYWERVWAERLPPWDGEDLLVFVLVIDGYQ